MIETEFLFDLLMRLRADPARPDGRGESLQIGLGFQRALRSLAPIERSPPRLSQHVFGFDGQDIGHVPFAGPLN